MHQKVGRRQRGFTVLEMLVVFAIIGILSSILIPGLQEALHRARRASLTADARTLFVAIFLYASDRTSYPPARDSPVEALDPVTLHPLTTRGYLTSSAITRKLQGGKLSLYEASGTPDVVGEFYAVLTDARFPDIVLVVADTNNFPGHEGEALHGLYSLKGENLVPVTSN